MMHLPEQIYGWLVSSKIIPNEGELDQQRKVAVPASTACNLENGFIVGQVIRRIITLSKGKVPSALLNVKSDSSKNTKLTNWNFIWLTFDSIGLRLEGRIKQLILAGESALIVEVLRQLQHLEPQPQGQTVSVQIRQKVGTTARRSGAQAVDVKKINLGKDPVESESSLEFLILLLKASLGMSLEQILGLFTNQNKLLSHIIVRGVNDNFEPIILFYSLLNKHAHKLRHFQQLDARDAEACLFAIKTGFVSKSPTVAHLALQLFAQMDPLYHWFVAQDSKCSATLLLGVKRHRELRERFWALLLQIIKGEEAEYFTTHYAASFQDHTQQIEVTSYLLKPISQCFLNQLLTSLGVVVSWIQMASQLPESQLAAQETAIDFFGELLLQFPGLVEQNQEFLGGLGRNWQKYNLCQFVTLATKMIGVLDKLAAAKSSMARRIYEIISEIARKVGAGDKREYLIQNLVVLLRKFANIPSEQLLKSAESNSLSNSEYLLACETIEVSQDFNTLLSVGSKLKAVFIDNPLVNHFLISLLKEIAMKIAHSQAGNKFIESVLEDALGHYSVLFLKYRPRPKQQNSLYFGKSGSPSKVSKPEQEELYLKQRWKELYLKVVKGLSDLAFAQDSDQLKQIIKQKLLNCNSKIRLSNFKVASKEIEEILSNRFGVEREDQLQHLEQFRTKLDQKLSDSMLNRSKAPSQPTLARLKGPQHLTKEFQSIVDRRRAEEQSRLALEIKKQLWEQKRKVSVRKEMEIANLLRGQIGEAQLREQGFFHRLIQDSKQYDLVFFEEMEQTELQAIDSLLKRYHRVLRHVFLNYSATMYSSHTFETIQDNIKRKQTLTAVELARFLKDYGFFANTSQPEISSIVRDINVKILHRREVNQLDFTGFQQFLIQFCFNSRAKMQRNKQAVAGNSEPKANFSLPVYSNLRQFFSDLKAAFIQLGQKVTVFEHIEDIPLSKEQAYTISILNQKVRQNQNYILPAGYKKIAEKSLKFYYKTSPYLEGFQESFSVAYEVLEEMLFRQFDIHILEPYSQKKTSHKVKPILPRTSDQVLQRQRASSTTILKKTPMLAQQQKQRSASRQLLQGLKPLSKELSASEPAARKAEDNAIKKMQDLKSLQKQKQGKQPENKKKVERQLKNAELMKAKLQKNEAKGKQKQTERERQIRKEKSEERRRREQTQRFVEEQAAKNRQKQLQEQEQERMKRQKLAEERELQIRENKEKFKVIHHAQIQKIRRIELQASEKIKRQEEQEAESHDKIEEQRRRLREQIEQQDKSIIQTRKQAQSQLTQLYQSQPIASLFKTYQPNLQALFEFLLNRTHYSLTQKRHNNELIYDVWKYFLNNFEVSPLILNPKEAVGIFKSLTKDKIAAKEHLIGLSYQEFQQALLRIAVKHKTIFNIISTKIIDQIKQTSPPQTEADKKNLPNAKNAKESLKKSTKQPNSKQQAQKSANQLNSPKQLQIKQILKADNADKDEINEYGDISKAGDKTLRGLIYYLRVPSNKPGQEIRFRQILNQKHSGAVHNTEKLKEKLQAAYTLQNPVKGKEKVQSKPKPV